MSFPKYDRYKNSGVEWLGEVPEHWEVGHVKRLATKITDGSHISPETENGVYAFISTKDVRNDSLDFDNCLRTSVENYEYLVRTGCKPIAGDVLFSKDGTIGRTVVIKEDRDFVVASSLIIISPDQNILSSVFLNYLCQSSTIASQVECFVKGAGLPRLSIQNLLRIIGVFPPLPEQRSIATFLDRETTKIDELIAEQQQLIDLLKEKRQAVISHAVIKGLNPDAPMKDSAIEWLGEVPEHWEVMQLRFFAEILRGKFTHRPRNDPDFYDGDYPFIQTGDITGASRYITEHKQTLNERGISVSKEFPKGTLVMTIAANIGDVAILGFPAYFPDSIVGFFPVMSVDLMFLYYLIGAMKQPMTRMATVSTQMNLNIEQIASLSAACPPIQEQKAIVDYLDKVLTELAQLIAEAQHAIALLRERRTALISAAVTGKIDVRSLV